jgi:hypothetical protein
MMGRGGGWKREMAGKRKQNAVVVFVFHASSMYTTALYVHVRVIPLL